jgi:GntR family transcriptional repressor for pyruvate dehydrogenase complex
LAVAGWIKQRIASGEFARGAQLPTERVLAERSGVSRTAIREAVKLLQAQGLISVRHGYGTFVKENADEALSVPMETLLGFGDISLDEIMSVRQIIEPPLASYAARHRTATNLRDITKVVTTMLATADPYEHEQLDAEFHHHIANIFGNRLAIQLLKSIRGLLQVQLRQVFDRPDWVSSADKYHQLILDAIHARDADGAEQMMKEHLQTSQGFMNRIVQAPAATRAPRKTRRAHS